MCVTLCFDRKPSEMRRRRGKAGEGSHSGSRPSLQESKVDVTFFSGKSQTAFHEWSYKHRMRSGLIPRPLLAEPQSTAHGLNQTSLQLEPPCSLGLSWFQILSSQPPQRIFIRQGGGLEKRQPPYFFRPVNVPTVLYRICSYCLGSTGCPPPPHPSRVLWAEYALQNQPEVSSDTWSLQVHGGRAAHPSWTRVSGHRKDRRFSLEGEWRGFT